LRRERLAHLPPGIAPASTEQAYSSQERYVERLINHFGGHTIGYKIACTNELAQRLLRVPEPFHGRLLSSFFQPSPARFRAGDFFMRVIEAEFGFRFARDLQVGARPATRDEIVDALEGVLPSIEIVDSRYSAWTDMDAPALIADNAAHGAWVAGALVRDWQHIDLAAQAVELRANGKTVETGSGAAVLGHPLNALTWLAGRLHARGVAPRAGEYVTTGVTTDIFMAHAGDEVVADFGPLGSVAVRFD
jgi:2-keto-4-pentenoate hydratase